MKPGLVKCFELCRYEQGLNDISKTFSMLLVVSDSQSSNKY